MKKTFTIAFLSTLALVSGAYGCGDDDDSPSNPGGSGGSGGSGGAGGSAAVDTKITSVETRQLSFGVHSALGGRITSLKNAAVALCAAAPADVAGWEDPAKVDAMKAEWVKAREEYERIEGVIAPVFGDIDESIDQRYDYFIEEPLMGAADPNLFDGEGVTGMHAIERILYNENAPEALAIESQQLGAGYTAPSYPDEPQEVDDFKAKLCQKYVDDATALESQWADLIAGEKVPFNLADVYNGLLGLVGEQQEKVVKASTQFDESRYSKRTMADLRANLDGVKTVYALISPILVKRTNAADAEKDGPTIDAKIKEGFVKLDTAFAKVSGDAIPPAPATWSMTPSAADLATPFGELYTAVSEAVDPAIEGSIGHEMEEAAEVLGFPPPPAELPSMAPRARRPRGGRCGRSGGQRPG